MSAHESSSSEVVQRECDVVVVGCGMAGLSAALSAAENDASVVILEKAPEKLRGGQTQYSESFRIPGKDIDLDIGFHRPEYSASDFYQDVMTTTDGRADPELTRAMTSGSAEAFEWLTEKIRAYGMEWRTEPLRAMYTSTRVWHEGDQLIDVLVTAAEDAGVEIYYEAEARSLLRDSTARVTGVEAVVGENRERIRADATVIACGGFESNAEKRTRYFGGPYEEMTVRGVRYNTGEAIDMALDVGAKAAGQWSGAHMAIIGAGSPSVEVGQTQASGYQYGIILNHRGERFVDEGQDTRARTYAKFGRRIFEQPYREAFVVQDSTTNEYMFHTGPIDPIESDSIEGLFAKLDIGDQETAVETVEAYNANCDPEAELDPNTLDGNSTDGLTLPKSNWAVRLDDPPYYGYPVTGGITFTFGGLAQNTDAAVLDTSDDPIPGLYAAGNAAGGIFYGNYPGSSGLTKALVFGRIAGQNAAAESA